MAFRLHRSQTIIERSQHPRVQRMRPIAQLLGSDITIEALWTSDSAKLPTTQPTTGPLRDRIPQLERTHLLHTEADVLRASFLYLLHPVDVAVSRLLGTGSLDCRGEVSSMGGCRNDIKWVYRNGNQTTNIAVLEFKNTKVMHWQDFGFAMANSNNAKTMRDSAQGNNLHTHFRNNAVWLSKQARKYSASVPDVALFDWSTMFIFDFNGMDEDILNPILANGIWFTESTSNHNQGESFRTLLLGFLVRALVRHNIIQ
ncbi:hypothetical protein MMC24_007846 [Lignoscripta atroalba]|nr:hypothetical protein [Lignoscripta atroalba]